jgi:hypothetical protein
VASIRVHGHEASVCLMREELSLLLFFTLFLTPCLFLAGGANAQSSTYEAVLKGKSCKLQSNGQTLSCDYKVGTDLHVSIDGIGDPDTGITIFRSDFDGDFYVTYGTLHGCLIVKRGPKSYSDKLSEPGGMLDYAFISPRNGKVYTTWRECRSGP